MSGRLAGVLVAVVGLAAAAWYFWPGEKAAIDRRLAALSRDIDQQEAVGGLAAARIASHFTEDVVIDLGQGSVPVEGRDTLVGMLMRLEPRIARYRVRFEDATVRLRDASTAEVTLTAEIVPRGSAPRDAEMDAREFEVMFRKVDADWLVARVRAVETIR
ncbi:MAG TPA: nuclear transport factor 2 family protein [Vicinamibacterales bacterium]|nr:nuclear transport factor 2 family protein [Vicinamibacterales bacterium]